MAYWQACPENYDAPPGEKVKTMIRVDVPGWLEWLPDEITDWIVKNMVGMPMKIAYELYDAFNDEVSNVEVLVEIVEPGNLYYIHVYYTSGGIPVWAAAAIVLSLIAAVIFLFGTVVEKVERLVETTFPGGIPWWIVIGGFAITGVILYSVLKSRKKSQKRKELT